jgi:hypothetical protein
MSNTMNKPRKPVPVLVYGPGLPEFGKRFENYKSALANFGIKEEPTDRQASRDKLHEGKTVEHGKYSFRKTN